MTLSPVAVPENSRARRFPPKPTMAFAVATRRRLTLTLLESGDLNRDQVLQNLHRCDL